MSKYLKRLFLAVLNLMTKAVRPRVERLGKRPRNARRPGGPVVHLRSRLQRPVTPTKNVDGEEEPGRRPLISCENLVKIYKVSDLEVVALQGLDLTIYPGRDDRDSRQQWIGQDDLAEHSRWVGPAIGR